MKQNLLENERLHLTRLLEALQRCAYFLHMSRCKLSWPIEGEWLSQNKKDPELFETLAAINERFAKLQDTLAAAMRHTALLMSEPTESFLKVLTFFEKNGVIESVELWQQSRAARNMAAHDYETHYHLIAEHFNTLDELSEMLLHTAKRLIHLIETDLGLKPLPGDFSQEFAHIFE